MGRSAAIVLAAVMAACSAGAGGGDAEGPLDVVAAFYPLAFAAERVGGERVDVVDLTPPGVEPHDLELDPDQVDDLQTADVVLYAGGGFQPAVERSLADADGAAVDVLAGMDLRDGDPHVWLDPVLMGDLVGTVRDGLAAADPGGAGAYDGNAEALAGDLDALHGEMAEGLAGCRGRLLVTTHDAFGYLADRFGLDHEGIAGVSPEGEVDPARLAELADLVEERDVATVFSEELVPADLVETLAAEAGAGTATLHPLESAPEDGDDYLAVMRQNLAALQEGLACG